MCDVDIHVRCGYTCAMWIYMCDVDIHVRCGYTCAMWIYMCDVNVCNVNMLSSRFSHCFVL